MYIITKQNIISNELEFVSAHTRYEIALSEIHKILNEHNDKNFIKIKKKDTICVHKRGYIFNSPELIYRIKEAPKIDCSVKKECNFPKKKFNLVVKN